MATVSHLENLPQAQPAATGTGLPTGSIFAAMLRYPVLDTREEFEELFRVYKFSRNPAERDKALWLLLCGNIRLVMNRARKYLGLGSKFEDLVQVGLLVLQEKALPKFDLKRGLRFSTYATPWLRHAMLREIQDRGTNRPFRVPVHQQEALRLLRKGERVFCKEHGRQPSSDELAELLEVSPRKIARTLKADVRSVSFEKPISDGSGRTLADLLAAPTDGKLFDDRDPLEVREAKERAQALLPLLKKLTPQEADIVWRRYGISGPALTLEELGAAYGVTRERIRQVEMDALRKLMRRSGLGLTEVEGLLTSLGEYGWAKTEDLCLGLGAQPEAVPQELEPERLEAALALLSEHAQQPDHRYAKPFILAPGRTLEVRLNVSETSAAHLVQAWAAQGWIELVPGHNVALLVRTDLTPKKPAKKDKRFKPVPTGEAETAVRSAQKGPGGFVREATPEVIAHALAICRREATQVGRRLILRGVFALLGNRLHANYLAVTRVLERLEADGQLRPLDGWRSAQVMAETHPEQQSPRETLRQLASRLRLHRRLLKHELRRHGVACVKNGVGWTYDIAEAQRACAEYLILPRAAKDGVVRGTGPWLVAYDSLHGWLGISSTAMRRRLPLGQLNVTPGLTHLGVLTPLVEYLPAKQAFLSLGCEAAVSRRQLGYRDADGAWLSLTAITRKLSRLSGSRVTKQGFLDRLSSDLPQVRTRTTWDERGSIRVFYHSADLLSLLFRRVGL